MAGWRDIVRSLYPDLHTKTYFVPPVYFNRVPYRLVHIDSQPALVQRQASGGADVTPSSASKSPSKSKKKKKSQCPEASEPSTSLPDIHDADVREDFAQQHVLHCLQKLADTRKDVMFIISQLNFRHYLNKSDASLKTPSCLGRDYSRGDFDVLIVHKERGILIGEIKSVGQNVADLNKSQSEADKDIATKMKKAVSQLDKSATVMKELMKDIAPNLPISKRLILPYVSAVQLQRVLSQEDPEVVKKMCQCLNVPDEKSAVESCLTSDFLSDRTTPSDVTDDVVARLGDWFDRHHPVTEPSRHMSDDVYVDIVSRLAGPETTVKVHCAGNNPRVTVEVRTMAEAVAELGERFAAIVLTQEQQGILNKAESLPLVCLVGPPGTGKSLMLELVGRIWLGMGQDILILSTRLESFAVSLLIEHRLKAVIGGGAGQTGERTDRVELHHFDFRHNAEDAEREAYKVLMAAATAKGGTLHMLMDEVWFTSKDAGPCLKRLVTDLSRKVKLHLWAGTMRNKDIPECLEVVPLTVPLRCAPIIQKEVGQGLDARIPSYTSNGIPAPSDGPDIITLDHQGEGHNSGQWPLQCSKCGEEVARVLKDVLKVGVKEPDDCTSGTVTRPPCLKFKDVFVLVRSSELKDDGTGCAFLCQLRTSGIPVMVISKKGENDKELKSCVQDMAWAETDKVTVADVEMVHGLERKVVVCVPGRKDEDKGISDEKLQELGRLYAASRCTTQLIVINVP